MSNSIGRVGKRCQGSRKAVPRDTGGEAKRLRVAECDPVLEQARDSIVRLQALAKKENAGEHHTAAADYVTHRSHGDVEHPPFTTEEVV